jgi:hypothetical protein
MKINVTVDLEDFYPEEEGGNISEQVKELISNQVKNEIWKKFEKDGFESFCNQVERKINLDKDLKIKECLDTLFKDKKTRKSRWDANKLLSIEEYINENVDAEYFHNGNKFDVMVRDYLSKKTESIGKDLKDRYDLLFASQIVSNLNKNGMLKDDIAKILLKE